MTYDGRPMTEMDPELERNRLAESYERKPDAELIRLAGQKDQLTEIARGALDTELRRRGLSAPSSRPRKPAVIGQSNVGRGAEHVSRPDSPLNSTPSTPTPPVTIRAFRDLPEALLAKGSLESAGIDCSLLDENIVRLDWFWSNLMGGIKLQVAPEDAESANQILSEPIPATLYVEGVGDIAQTRCPKCESLDVAFQEPSPVAYVTAYLCVPIPLKRRAWRCHSCGAQWEDGAELGPGQQPPAG
jgi:hypothetical protein